jgi:branched-chain amino acid aminotransferase
MFRRLLAPKIGASLTLGGCKTFRNATIMSAAALPQARNYSIKADNASAQPLMDIDPKLLKVQRTGSPKKLLPANELIFGKNFTGRIN